MNNDRLIVECQNLVKHFGEICAVDDLSIGLREGETLGLLGPNGAGKTTAINMMIGLVQPTEGEVKIADGLAPKDREARNMIGVAPQSLSLYEDLNGEENLAFFGKLYGLRGSQLKDRVQWALDFAKLQDRRRHLVKTYSGGMKRRLNFACSLVHDPKIVLLDEPTVGVDPQSRNHIFDGVEQLQQNGLTVIYTTHYMEEAQRLCDRVAIIDHGKLLELDSVDHLIERYGGNSVVTGELAKASSGFELPGKLDGLSWRMESNEPIAEIAKLTNAGIDFTKLQIAQPDLESVFLSLTGRSLRD